MTKRTVQLLYCDHCGASAEGDQRMYELHVKTPEEVGVNLGVNDECRHFCSGKCLHEWASGAVHDGVPASIQRGTSAAIEGLQLPRDPDALRERARMVLQTTTPLSSQYENIVRSAQIMFALAELFENTPTGNAR